MKIKIGNATVVTVLSYESAAPYPVKGTATARVPVAGPSNLSSRTSLVELTRGLGGMMQRGRLGGEIGPPIHEGWLTVEVLFSSDPKQVSGPGHSMTTGFPREYVASAMAGVLSATHRSAAVRLDRASFDAVDSSQAGFVLLGRLLARALTASSEAEFEEAARTILAPGA